MKTITKTKNPAENKEIILLENKIKNFTIKGGSDLEKATEMLSQANRYLDELTRQREKITKPINEALKEVRARYKPSELKLTEIIQAIRSSMSSYQTKQIALQKESEAKLLKKIESGAISLEKGAQKMSELSDPNTRVETTSGSIKFREDKRLKITDSLLIPREFLSVNESAVLSALKAGKTVPGAEIELVQVPINSR